MKIKTYALLAVLLFTVFHSYGQIDTMPQRQFSEITFNKQIDAYFKKGRNQTRVAWILLGGGFGLNIISSSLAYSNYSGDPGSAYEVLSTISGIATIASVPVFFVGSANKQKARLLSFRQRFDMAASDTLKKLIIEDAADYFSRRADANLVPAIILSAAGGAMIIGGVAAMTNNDADDVRGFFDEALFGPAFVASGVMLGVLSIPFYSRSAHHNRTAKMLLRTGRFPVLDIGSVRPVIKNGRQIQIGVAFGL